ncbi:hypothetical protein [Rhizobium sp. 28DA2]|uniref:hypothetical protein n=1 Tax=Rhizobium sp. 28DA2 TaxID=3035209 RepID=UPI002B240AE7|nr:hypothetical protein [Rhizobium sp. 28DA2]
MISNAETIALLRNRIANLDPEQRALLRSQIEARGMSWHDVAPEGDDAGGGAGRLPLTSSQMHFWLQQKIFPERTGLCHSLQVAYRRPSGPRHDPPHASDSRR